MSTLPIILSLETATMGGSVFVGCGSFQLAAVSGDPQVSQSNSLLRDIDNAMGAAQLTLQDVGLFACAAGPGSFTGLRIGIATLKALAATLDRPCAGIPTLKAIAQAAGPSSGTVALLPAGRGELFAQMFSVSHDHQVREIDSAAHLSPGRLIDRYGALKDLIWAGAGAHQQREFLETRAKEQGIAFAEAATGSPEYPQQQPGRIWRLAAKENNLARHVAALALQLFEGGELQSADAIQAIYVRPSDAELNEQCR